MAHTRFKTDAWYQALTLAERLGSLRALGGATPESAINGALADKRLRRWREQNPFPEDDIFAQRLALDAMSEAEFRALLGEPIPALRKRWSEPLVWLEQLEHAFDRPMDAEPLPAELHDRAASSFLHAIGPLIRQGRERVRAGVQALMQECRDLPFDPATIDDLLFANLPGRLLMMLTRTMTAEINIARMEGTLHGDTPEGRFQSFLERLRDPDNALDLLELYPVLARQLAMAIDTWVFISLEFLRRLCVDWAGICARFRPDADPGVLAKANAGAGDVHKGGRSVIVLEFSSGWRLIYKPRSLAVEAHFQELLAWLNERGAQPPLRTLTILDRRGYGWVEFVPAHGCATPDEVERFYRRQGAYLALLYALEATDFHHENLIAAGEHPLLIDLESLFHARLANRGPMQSEDLANQAADHSVLRSLMLPVRFLGNDAAEGIDLSGLGGAAGQLSPKATPELEAAGTDEMRFVRRRQVLPGSQNRPNLNGAEANPLHYTEAIVAGFTDMYRLLMRERDALLAASGPIASFAEDEVRVILRPTHTYGILLYESFHPYLLRNALDRDRHFDRLWLGREAHPYQARTIAAERADLLRGDIPLFTTRINTRDIWSSAGERIADLLDEPGLALVRQRIAGLSEVDLDRQTWFIRASMATLADTVYPERLATDHRQLPQPRPNSEEHRVAQHAVGNTQQDTLVIRRSSFVASETEGALEQRLLAAACAIGDRLETLALRNDNHIAWLGLVQHSVRHWEIVPAGLDLYHGLPGIALFLAYLGHITQQERYTALARAVAREIRYRSVQAQPAITAVGGFDGWGGVIYALSHLGALWSQPELLAEAEDLVERLPALIEQDESLDIISGAAGCIGGLLSLYRCAPSERTLATAVHCGERLIDRAQPKSQGVGWLTLKGLPALTGFAHGAAGIAWALLELAALTGQDRFRAAALAGMAYEHSLFSAEAGNWPDLRKSGDEASYATLWCHGAPGIGLARLLILPHQDDAAVRAEIDVALNTTLAHGLGHGHALCHGDLGNLETLLLASQTLDDPRWRLEIERLAASVLDSINQAGWRCATPLAVETPGLMIGLAGIGYGLLRLADPARVPSVLALEAPRL